ncbi:hypothetical protein LUZ60_000552 [Juncus effusus]|nr:hypothetical protein LUZ60_000552 [Juncus effusus]
MVQESHLSQLKFLSLIIKETLRRHPTVPLLVPRCSSSPCTLDKYLIPAGTTVYVNAWAIQTDPKNWTDPFEFKPERFLEEDGERDFTGNQFDFLPFGSGKRICVSALMAKQMLEYFLATMVHSFDWKVPEGSEIDMSASFGIVLKKITPLVAIPTPRLSNND